VTEQTARDCLVRLGRLDFDDFRLLPDDAIRHILADPALLEDWNLALNNTPHILARFRSVNLQSAICNLQSDLVPTLAQVRSAQSRLVRLHALLLLREKSPPLYDSLPWHEWDFSRVTKRCRLWQTRFLLAGDGAGAIMPILRKSAGVVLVEPSSTLAPYLARKAELERIKRFRLLTSDSWNPQLLDSCPPVDFAIVGALPLLPTADRRLLISAAIRVAPDVLVVENNPLAPRLPEDELRNLGFSADTVNVRSLGSRPCWRRSSN